MVFSTENLRLRKNVLLVANTDDPRGDEVIRVVREYDPEVEVRYKDQGRYEGFLPSLYTPLSAFDGLEDIKAFIAAEAEHPIVKEYLAKHGRR